MRRHSESGFTLIELMIVVAIIGLLAIIAVPTYQDYTIRARVSEAINLASQAQLTVSEYAEINGKLPTNATQAGYASPNATVNVASIGIKNGVITVTTTTVAGHGTLVFTPQFTVGQPITWTCTGGTLLAKYRPSACRA